MTMRTSGILMHISSLPSPHGIGAMGAAAREFVDFLSHAGQTYWQILPICPTSFGDSPYQSFSTYAGNPYLIDLDDLAAEGLLNKREYEGLDWGTDPLSVDFGLLYERRYGVLKRACARLLAAPPASFTAFCAAQGYWLEDYAFFMALKDLFGGASWQDWPVPLRSRDPAALTEVQSQVADGIAFWRAVQYLFFRQWDALKTYANGKGISIIGDLPIYVSGDSVEVWAHPEQFQLDQNRLPTEVAGCPPDGFSGDGQLWGNPLFDWDFMERDGYTWWISRIRHQCAIYDVLRIDHFRGFDTYYAIPYGAKDAKKGKWRQGPGMKLFRAVNAALGERDIIAEDLGFLTPSVRKLLKDSGYPGMKVLEFAFDSRDESCSDYLPHTYPNKCVVYTGTHDNDTVLGWFDTALTEDADYAKEYLRLTEAEGLHWGMMRAAWGSVADLAVVQMQDVLGLGRDSRMNIPATVGTNWKWRCAPGLFTPALAARLRRDMQLYGRMVKKEDSHE